MHPWGVGGAILPAVGAVMAYVGPIVVVVVIVFLVLFMHCLCWVFPVLRGAGVISRQVAGFGVLTLQIPCCPGLPVPPWGV